MTEKNLCVAESKIIGMLKDRYDEPERGEWMGADKNSSRRRWRVQQDEHGFQHTTPTHYPNWPSSHSHWSATEHRNQHTTFWPENTAEHQTSSLLTNTGQTSEHRRSDRSLLVKLATSTERLHTGQVGATHRSDRSQPESPKTPNRPTDLQTDPNSKQPLHRTTANTPRRSPEQKTHQGLHRLDQSRAPVRPV
jgi:hypothetical protein